MEIQRDIYLNKLKAARNNGMIKILTGMRRCGKSYLLFRLFYKHLIDNGVDESHIIKIDLEDRRNKRLRDPDELLHYIDSRLADGKMHYILLDEIQHVAEFEDVLNSYLKVENADVYVTGSNSKFLSKDVVTEFRGRGLEIRIHPLCFAEFMSAFKGGEESGLREYMAFGGLPKLVDLANDEQKIDYLNNLFAKTYLTDIKERYRLKDDSSLMELVAILASSIGGLTNPTKLSNTFRTVAKKTISVHTIESYLDIMQDGFILERAVRYDIRGRRYIDTPAKYYFSDVGLRNAVIGFRQQEPTHLMENLIYNELRNRGYLVDVGTVVVNERDEGRNIRKQLEVDFVCNQGSKRVYIQSALHLPTEDKLRQELRPLCHIDDSCQKFVITADPVKRHQDVNGIVFLNVFDFLLNAQSLVF